MSTIDEGFANGGEMMATRRRHLKEAEVLMDGTTDRSIIDHPDIVFTGQDAEGLYFPHDDALIVKLTITRYFVKRILIDISSSVE